MTKALVFSLVLGLTGTLCGNAFAKTPKMTKKPMAATTEANLYTRLGGKPAITAVVDQFVTNCATDPAIKSFFAETAGNPEKLTAFKTNLINQICQAAGGPCKYTGKDMKTAHAGKGIKVDHFSALVGDLVKALDKFKVGTKEKDELIAVLGPMQGSIVE